MQKWIAVFLTAMLLMTASAAFAQDKPVIAASTYPLYCMAQAIGGENAEVVYAKNGKKDAKNAQIVLCVGNADDAWAEQTKATVVRATDGLELMDTDGNPVSPETSVKKLDTDVLTIPVNNMLCAYALADALSAMDAEHSQQYQDNMSTYVQLMIDLDMRFREAAQGIEAVTCKDGSMRYFAQEYGVVYEAKAGKNAVELHTYNAPGKADLELTYAQLMERNLEALNAAK